MHSKLSSTMRRRILTLGIPLASFLLPWTVYAYDLAADTGWNCAGFVGCGSGGNIFTYLMQRLTLIVSTFLFTLTVLVFLYGAIRMAISQGEDGKETGRKAMMYAAFGFLCTLLLSGVFRFICDYLYGLGAGALGQNVGMCATWWW